MSRKKRIVFYIVAIFVMTSMWVSNGDASGEYQLRLNLLPWSYHHGSTSATNERHKGIGLSLTLPNDVTYGVMHYENSFDDRGWMVSMSTEFSPYWGLHPGLGVGYAPEYEKSGHSVAIGWLSLRYKWFTLLTAPTEVSTIMLSIPFD